MLPAGCLSPNDRACGLPVPGERMKHVKASICVLVGGLVLASVVVSEAKDKHRGYSRGADRASRYDDYRQRDD